VELTNAERERAVESLKEAVRSGAISLDEFEDRLQATYAATSPDELEMLLTLHGLQMAVPKAPPRADRLRRQATLSIIVVAIVALLGVILVEVHSRARALATASSNAAASSNPAPSSGAAPPSTAAAVPPAHVSNKSLAKAVLSKTLWGLVATPPGISNGPFTASGLGQVLTEFPGERTLAGELATGQATGYVRTWVNRPADGDSVFIVALKFQNSADASNFLSVAGADGRSMELDEFLVPDVPGAQAFELLASQSHTGSPEYLVYFSTGQFFFLVGVVNGIGDLSTEDAATIATTQALNA
jgi:hypothetical protein